MNKVLFLALLFLNSCSSRADPVYFAYANDINKKFLCQVIKNDRMLPFGLGGAMLGDIQKFDISLKKVGCFSVDEARIMLVAKVEQLLKIINQDKRVRPYLHDYPATFKNVGISITFNKSEFESYPPPPNMASVRVINNTVYYDVSLAGNLDDFFEEPYETALQWVKENASWALENCEETSEDKALNSRLESLFGI